MSGLIDSTILGKSGVAVKGGDLLIQLPATGLTEPVVTVVAMRETRLTDNVENTEQSLFAIGSTSQAKMECAAKAPPRCSGAIGSSAAQLNAALSGALTSGGLLGNGQEQTSAGNAPSSTVPIGVTVPSLPLKKKRKRAVEQAADLLPSACHVLQKDPLLTEYVTEASFSFARLFGEIGGAHEIAFLIGGWVMMALGLRGHGAMQTNNKQRELQSARP